MSVQHCLTPKPLPCLANEVALRAIVVLHTMRIQAQIMSQAAAMCAEGDGIIGATLDPLAQAPVRALTRIYEEQHGINLEELGYHIGTSVEVEFGEEAA